MIIRPDNRYTRRFGKLAQYIPLGVFVLIGGGLVLNGLISTLTDPKATVGWTGIVVVTGVLGVLCLLLSGSMSRRGFSRMLERIGTHLTPESILFENPYFGRVELFWDDITEMRLSEEKGHEGIYFKLREGSDSIENNSSDLLRGKELERAQGYHWRMTPDLYDRPAPELFAFLHRYWHDSAARGEL
jgi:hypothetical protein